MRRSWPASVLVASTVLIASACGTDTEGRDPTTTLTIRSPEVGAEVSVPFTVEVSSNVELGEPGRAHHLRIFYDGIDVGTASGATFEVEQLDAGPHAIHVSLLEADGSLAGAEDEITVTVTGGS